MHDQGWLRAGRVMVAVLGLTAVVVQFVSRASDPRPFDPVSFFSFFTILSNLLVAAVLLTTGTGRGPAVLRRDTVRGAATAYIVTTGLIYLLLLSDDPVAVDATIPWVDRVLHQVVPVAMVVDWLVAPPRASVTVREAAGWLAFPVGYLVYSLARGPLVDWYPYPFLDPREVGYAVVARTSVVVAVAIVGIIAAVRAVGNQRAGAVAVAPQGAP